MVRSASAVMTGVWVLCGVADAAPKRSARVKAAPVQAVAAKPVVLKSAQRTGQPGPQKKTFGKACEPKELNALELEDLAKARFLKVTNESPEAIAKSYSGLVKYVAEPWRTKTKTTKAFQEVLAPAFQAVVVQGAKAARAAMEATYRHAYQELVAAIRLTTETHRAAALRYLTKDGPRNRYTPPPVETWARRFYSGLRRMFDGLEALRRLEGTLQLPLGEALIEKLNKTLRRDYVAAGRWQYPPFGYNGGAWQLYKTPAEKMGATGKPNELARRAYNRAYHAAQRYRHALAELLKARKEKSPTKVLDASGWKSFHDCFVRAAMGQVGVKEGVKKELETGAVGKATAAAQKTAAKKPAKKPAKK